MGVTWQGPAEGGNLRRLRRESGEIMGMGAFCGSRGSGGTEDKEGGRVCPRGSPDGRNWNVSWGDS